MAIELKPLSEQVIVITGATSGIGFATARLAAKRGARVVLVSRSKSNLRRAVRQIRKNGGEAIPMAADVADPHQVERVAETAIRKFGQIDTWVNNAGTSVYGRLEEVPLEDARRVFETNYWGMVHGTLVAVAHLREKGGAILNIGSVVSDVPLPLQGHYSASKRAVKGFTDTLRIELEKDEVPISLTLIKPASIDTPFPRHAKSYLEVEPTLPPPVYAPRVVARAILHCAEHPEREVTVGGGGKMMTALGTIAPRLTERYMEMNMFRQQKKNEPAPRHRKDSLHRPQKQVPEERGDYQGHVMRTSAYTHSVLHPLQTALGVALLGAVAAMAMRGNRPPAE